MNLDTQESPELPRCRYCKGQFRPLPKNKDKQAFCCESHRKMHWKYGSQSVGKLAERMQRENKKLIASELKAARKELWGVLEELRGRLDALEARGGAALCMMEQRLQALEARGGAGAAA